jgi:hypothetical protein
LAMALQYNQTLVHLRLDLNKIRVAGAKVPLSLAPRAKPGFWDGENDHKVSVFVLTTCGLTRVKLYMYVYIYNYIYNHIYICICIYKYVFKYIDIFTCVVCI